MTLSLRSAGYTDTTAVIGRNFWTTFSLTYTDSVSTVPEPSIIALFAAGLFGIGLARRRQSKYLVILQHLSTARPTTLHHRHSRYRGIQV
ncbi:MAG: PEP-CTERM sorting domain-containing protein [Proteobacteria bacterium]|nr:PEP-CTERM sorting domain-containing protein [Pseudomonadota bacterium]